MNFRVPLFLLLCLLLSASGLFGQTSESKAERDLRNLVERQKTLLARAAKAEVQEDVEDLRPQLQTLIFDYEEYLRNYPNVAAGYVSYALLLGNPLLDEGKRAAVLLLKANSLDPNLAIVKNQLGKYLAEEGRPLEALNYFLAAVQLEPKEPLYHFQIGQLLSAAREDFLKSGEWSSAQIETAMRDAFEQATNLAPDNFAYAYRWAESYYDLEYPEWAEALEVWRALEKRGRSPIEKQTVQLHQANILTEQKKWSEAEQLLKGVTEDVLQSQVAKLREKIAELKTAAGAGEEP